MRSQKYTHVNSNGRNYFVKLQHILQIFETMGGFLYGETRTIPFFPWLKFAFCFLGGFITHHMNIVVVYQMHFWHVIHNFEISLESESCNILLWFLKNQDSTVLLWLYKLFCCKSIKSLISSII